MKDKKIVKQSLINRLTDILTKKNKNRTKAEEGGLPKNKLAIRGK